jgi:DNA-binding beta-propeller fold protein YncE
VVALHRPDRIALVDTRTLHPRIAAVPGGARHLVLAKPGGPVLLPAEDTNALLQVRLPSGRVVRSTALPRQPHNVTVVDGNYWVDDELASELSVVSPAGRILATLKGPVQPGGVAEAAGRVGAVDVRGARMYFYDASTYASEGSIAIGAGPTHALPVGGTGVVVADTRGGAVLLVDMATRRIVSRLQLPGGPYGLVSNPATGDVWVTLTETNRLVHVVARNGELREVGSLPTVQQPNTVARDPHTGCLYVAGVTQGQLEVICHKRHPLGRG